MVEDLATKLSSAIESRDEHLRDHPLMSNAGEYAAYTNGLRMALGMARQEQDEAGERAVRFLLDGLGVDTLRELEDRIGRPLAHLTAPQSRAIAAGMALLLYDLQTGIGHAIAKGERKLQALDSIESIIDQLGTEYVELPEGMIGHLRWHYTNQAEAGV